MSNTLTLQDVEATLKNPDTRLKALYDLLGNDVVLLPLQKGEKGIYDNEWQKTTLEDSQKPEYQKRLLAGNIGVLLGNASNDLCSIDIDSEEVFEEFLELNPFLKGTLHTKRSNPGNFWIRVSGRYPNSKPLKYPDGRRFGEWRANGNQTVIYGCNKEIDYTIVNATPPIEVEFSKLCFLETAGFTPQDSVLNDTCYAGSAENAGEPFSVSPVFSTSSAFLHNKTKKSPVQKRKEQNDFMNDLKKLNSKLPDYFERHVLYPFRGIQAGDRNSALVELTSKLYFRIKADLAYRFTEGFYFFYGDRFKDSFEDHRKEYLNLLDGLDCSFLEKLCAQEKEYYGCLELYPDEKDAFRIGRSLAEYEAGNSPVGRFFLSCNELAMRLGKRYDPQAERILKILERQGIIRAKVRGTKRSKGKKGRATEWEWCFPLS